MRSAGLLAGFALLGASRLASAGKCVPRPSSTTTGAGAVSSPSATTTAPAEVKVVVNDIANGNFAGYDPNWPGGVYGFNSTGDVQLIQGFGYQGDGSKETGCVQMTSGVQRRRGRRQANTDYNAMIEQKLENLDLTTQYTVRFFYTILESTVAGSCRYDAYYGDVLFKSTDYFPVVAKTNPGNTPWRELVTSAAVTTTDGYLKFVLNCASGAYAQVFIDQVFVSNKVTPDDVDNISLLYTSIGSATPTPSTPQSSTVVVTTTSSSSSPAVPASTEPSTSSSSSTVASSTTVPPTSTRSSLPSGVSSNSPAICVSLLNTNTNGKICSKRIYTVTNQYRVIKQDDITAEQCGAACFADPACQSFAWNTMGKCANTCTLSTAGAPDTSLNSGPTSPYAWDRACIVPQQCPVKPTGNVCVDRAPAKQCNQILGTPKFCATPFYSTPMAAQCGSSACRDLCMQYPSCKSFAVVYGANSFTCNLYAGSSALVATSGGSQLFTDVDCYQCDISSTFSYSYVAGLSDPAGMPPLQCSPNSVSSIVPSSTSSPTPTPSSSSTTSTTPTSAPTPTPETSTTSSPTRTFSGCYSGPTGTVLGQCTLLSPSPTGLTCAKQGTTTTQINYSWPRTIYLMQNSLTDCAVICATDPECKSYAFDVSNIVCRFGKSSIAKAGFVPDATASMYWSDAACADCVLCTYPSGSSTTSTTSSTSSTTAAASPTSTCALTNGQGCTLKTWVTAGSICQQVGSLTRSEVWGVDIRTYPYQGNPAQCAAVCAQIRGCASSAYDSRRGMCQFITLSLTGAGFKAGSGSDSVTWSDKACFDCPSCDPSSSTPTTSAPSSGHSTDPATTSSTSTSLFIPGYPESTATSSSSTSVFIPTYLETTSHSTASQSPEVTATPSSSGPSTSSSSAPSSTSSAACTAATPALSDLVTCGMPGSNGQQAQTAILPSYVIKAVGSLANCALVCLQRTDCKGFAYSLTDTACYPFTKGTADLGLTYSSSSKLRYYDSGCFSC
ncbi:uncharacterized protein E0L32_002898 [Thyridium curvatum]|uniref:Apple domain-containing protein n=1 Tax=Thyridium curvatum TaxID=1093900 RepID=A0A507BD09_9PEZI|nr:uncharacterized protein E0L32_002898 [Thyridium curvatum]TPX17797.1 hypothetical protein E0L32_002898 [Thyridium curvatum]